MNEPARPKKRGRPPKTRVQQTSHPEESHPESPVPETSNRTEDRALDEPSHPRKRGRPPKNRVQQESHPESPVPETSGQTEDKTVDEPSGPKKRGRPPKNRVQQESLPEPPEPETSGQTEDKTVDEPSRPKKRGRPPKNRALDDSQLEASELEINSRIEDKAVDEPSGPKKRGRPPKNRVQDEPRLEASEPRVNSRIEDDTLGEPSLLRKRGRPRKNPAQQESRPGPPESPLRWRQRRRERSSASPVEDNSAAGADDPVLEKTKRPRKVGKPTMTSGSGAEETNNSKEKVNDLDSSALRKSKRQGRLLDGPLPGSENESLAQQESKKRKRPIQRANKEHQEDEADPGLGSETDTTSKAQKKRKRKDHRSQNGQASVDEREPQPEAEPTLAPKRRGRPPLFKAGRGNSDARLPNEPSQARKEATSGKHHTESKQHRSSGAHRKSKKSGPSSRDHDQSLSRSSSPEPVSPPPYRHIEERTRQVTHDVIESKWSSLDPSSVANVAALLRTASQPPLLHVARKQYAHAEDVIEKVIRGLCKRSGRLPFPPASTFPRREDELDFEQTQSAVELLLSQLDPLQHSVELLRRAKEDAEKELEREYKLFDRLSTNARAEARERRDRLKKIHDLVPESTAGSTNNNSTHLLSADQGVGQVFSGIQDDELLALAGQISNHMESMHGNLQQIDGVLPAIAESHALLRTALQSHFGQKQLENIFLGQVES
ncbi:CENP-Q, a CENPA-CAD centromere complex subunit-domain-containing protein [Xylaria nigripes]|nr:CENP-Q, a CENPA-CAD centromere complex subunit-domain-containing protein [Xylaria nigripes]